MKKENNIFLNLGCYDGITNDPIYEYIKDGNMSGYFVDANSDVLIKCSDNFPNSKYKFECIGIYPESGIKEFYVAKDIENVPFWFKQTSTFNFKQVKQICDNLNIPIDSYRVERVKTETISDFIINRELDNIKIVNMDLEGLDRDIIFNFPFHYVKPQTIIIEIINEGVIDEDVYNFLVDQGYKSDRKRITDWSLIFKLKE